MICKRTVDRYCIEDIKLIENYDKVINDKTQTWDCHHRLETELNLLKNELIEKDLYYNRPASELIFLTKYEHNSLHFTGRIYTDEHKEKLAESKRGVKRPEETKRKISESLRGNTPGNKGKKKVWNDPNDKTKGFHFE